VVEHPMPTRWTQRLADEFEDDGVGLPGDPEFCRVVLELTSTLLAAVVWIIGVTIT
jgi:hypothetical protein